MMQIDSFLLPRHANHQPLTPLTLLWRASEAYAERTAVVDGTRRLSWRGFADWVRRIAGALRDSGVGVGDVVSIISPNHAETLAAHFAVPMAGAVLNMLNVRLDANTLAFILDHAGSTLLIAHTAHKELVVRTRRQSARQFRVLWFGQNACSAVEGHDDLLSDVVDAARVLEKECIVDEWQPICLNYTSGTTGHPKGVVYHHRGAFLNALGNVLTMGFSPNTRYLWVLPMFHCNGWAHTWAVTGAAGTHICLDCAEPPRIVRTLVDEGITHMCCAPVVLNMLVDEPSFRQLRLKINVCVGTGGAAPSPRLIMELQSAGMDLIHLYGLTECYGPTTFCGPIPESDELSNEEKSIRLARQGVPHALASDLKVIDSSGREVPADGRSIGEIVLRGNTLMAGYYKDEAATEKAFADEVFHTGDLAVRYPNGHVEIRDRAKDIIISGGENIASIEIESALQQHPSILIAAVVAMPHEKWGEVACAFIELRAGSQLPTEEELTAHCRERLAGFKVPKRFLFQTIPKTATGKSQKHILRKMLAEEFALGR